MKIRCREKFLFRNFVMKILVKISVLFMISTLTGSFPENCQRYYQNWRIVLFFSTKKRNFILKTKFTVIFCKIVSTMIENDKNDFFIRIYLGKVLILVSFQRGRRGLIRHLSEAAVRRESRDKRWMISKKNKVKFTGHWPALAQPLTIKIIQEIIL